MKIKGANLGDIEINSMEEGLSEYNLVNNHDLLLKLENMYYNLYKQAENQQINSIEIDETEHVVIKENMINHRCACETTTSESVEILESIAKKGVLASEWFGILESEKEARFCTFISRIKNENYSLSENNYSRLNIGKEIILFFDESNDIMKYLLHLDYFEFEHKKNTKSDEISREYTEEEIDLLEELIEPLSPAGKYMRKSYEFPTNYWSAIPGGIPPSLINVICIKNNIYDEDYLNQISCLFPAAVIFNGKKEVVRYPIKSEMNIKTI